MVSLFVLFCGVVDKVCVPATPPQMFPTVEACEAFMTAKIPTINLEAVTVEYRCFSWETI